jgi:hypothetical protein
MVLDTIVGTFVVLPLAWPESQKDHRGKITVTKVRRVKLRLLLSAHPELWQTLTRDAPCFARQLTRTTDSSAFVTSVT